MPFTCYVEVAPLADNTIIETLPTVRPKYDILVRSSAKYALLLADFVDARARGEELEDYAGAYKKTTGQTIESPVGKAMAFFGINH